jgi:cytosine/adenosine deaminase-related metal-dependent hydrolase
MRAALAFFFYYLLSFPLSAQITLNPTPTRVVGQDSLALTNFNPNLVEGREFYNPQGIALDLSTNPPALYVADTGNNRVLGFRNANSFANGQKADIVVGQPDLVTTLAAGPGRACGR